MMRPARLTPRQKIKIIKRVLKGGVSVASVCQQWGISRMTFYRWLKNYQKARPREREIALTDKIPRNEKHWRRISAKKEKETLEFVAKNPNFSVHQIADFFPSLGHHGIQNVLERHSLSRYAQRQNFAQQYKSKKELTPVEKSRAIQEFEEGKSISRVCLEFNIARPTFYRWYKRYQEKPDERYFALKSKRPEGKLHWKTVRPEIQEKILELIVKHPEYSTHKIAQILKEVGNHGAQNVLTRLGLNTYQLRLVYSQAQAPVITPTYGLPVPIRQLIGKIPVISAIPPPARERISLLARAFTASFISSVFFSTIFIYWLGTVTQAPTLNIKLGLVFASVSLLVGSFFFLYSMKYYFTLAIVLSFSRQPPEEGGYAIGLNGRLNNNQKNGGGWLARIFGRNGSTSSANGRTSRDMIQAGGLQPSLDHIGLERYPFVSIHLPFYNEKKVAERILKACTSMDYPNYEVIVVDDSTDETYKIAQTYANTHNKYHPNGPKIKLIHRETRSGFKGGALREALRASDPRTEFVVVFDADFIPYPDTLELFIKYFKVNNNGSEDYTKNNVACIAGYQWHVLNKSENWITRGVRTEYSGSYVIERSGQEILNALKLIHGSVYAIRADVLKKFGWGTSLTEDFELTLKLYEQGYKVVYTPYIQAPAECISTVKRLIRQRMRWAEGHSYCVKKMFLRLLSTPHMSSIEKLEFIYLSPYYLQAFFFLIGTFSWLLAETVFRARLPFWTSLWGWSLVLTNFLSLPLMNVVGLFLEESEEKDYQGIASFVFLSYLLVPFQAYASVKGFLEKQEGPWFRTPKTGKITDIFTRGRFYRWVTGILPGRGREGLGSRVQGLVEKGLCPSGYFRANEKTSSAYTLNPKLNPYLALATANNQFNSFRIKPKRIRWLANSFLVFLLLATTILFSLAPAISTKRNLISASEVRAQEITTPVDIRMPLGASQIVTTPNGNLPLEEPQELDFIFHQEPRVRVKLEDKELEFQTKNLGSKGANPKKSIIEGKKVTYEEVFPGIDLVYEVQESGVSEKFILKKPLVLEEIEQSLLSKELEPKEEGEEISFFDQTEEKVFSFGQPSIYEQANPEVKSFGIKFVLEKDIFGFKLKKQITEEGKAWLVDSTRVYPLVIDPTVIATSGTTFAITSYPTQRKIVKTSEGTLHAFIQTGSTTMNCGGTSKAGLLWVTSSDDGATWTCQGQLTSGSSFCASATMDSADNIYVVYSTTSSYGSTSYNVYYRKFTKGGGSTWTMEASQTALQSTLSMTTAYTYGVVELEGTTRSWLAARFYNDARQIEAIAANGSYWLIGGGACDSLVKYDGASWTDLASNLYAGGFNSVCNSVSSIAWNGSYWLIGGGQGQLAKYDGTSFTDQDSAWGDAGSSTSNVLTIAWNGTKWLLGGRNNGGNARLVECDTDLSCTNKTTSLIGFNGNDVNTVAWNSTDSYWLIGGQGAKLNKYDGTDFTDLSSSLVNFGTNAINSIAYNSTGNYFLIGGGGGKLNKYDGSTFTDLSGPTTGVADLQGSESNDGGFGTNAVRSIGWNGSYWLIGGASAKLAKYDGTNFTALSSSLVGFSSNAILSLSWDGTFSYWLIGGINRRLNKYDGSNFTDLSSNLDSSFGDDYYRVKVYYSDGLSAAPTWTESATLDTADTNSSNHIPTIVRFGTNIGVIYSENSSPELRWRKRADTDGLTTWDAEATVADLTGSPSYYFSATVDNSNQIHIGTSNGALQYLYYNGSSWSTPFTLGIGLGDIGISITTDGTDVYVLWRSKTGMSPFSGYYNAGILSFRKGVSPFTSSDFGSETLLNSSDRIYDKVWSYVGSSYTDETTDAGNDTTSDVTMPSAVDDIIYFGMTEKFRAVATRNQTAGVACVIAWEYYNGAWISLTLVDYSSQNFTSSKTGIYFNPPSDWTQTQVNTDSSPGFYYVRARVTTACTTAPVGTKAISAPNGSSTSTIAKLTSGNMPVIWTEYISGALYCNAVFATVPENLWILLFGLPFLPAIFKRRRYD